jgi:hypothetical protein
MNMRRKTNAMKHKFVLTCRRFRGHVETVRTDPFKKEHCYRRRLDRHDQDQHPRVVLEWLCIIARYFSKKRNIKKCFHDTSKINKNKIYSPRNAVGDRAPLRIFTIIAMPVL